MKLSLRLPPQAPLCRPCNRPQEVVIGLHSANRAPPSHRPMVPTQRAVPAGGRGWAGARRNDLYCSAEGENVKVAFLTGVS